MNIIVVHRSSSSMLTKIASNKRAHQIIRQVSSTLDVASDEYQLLHKSEIPTYHFQKSLRRLPIPKLENSCRRYLDAVRAVMPNQGIQETEVLVEQFLKGEGPELQKNLIEFDKLSKNTSYISEPWFDMYLSARTPCPINCNPFMMFSQDPDARYNKQLVRAANFVIACGRFKKALDAELLEPEVFHLNPKKSNTPFFRRVCKFLPPSLSWFGAVAFSAFPLDMSQYQSLFGGCRIPQKGKDRFHLNRNSRHFLVSNKGHFYTVELFDQNGMLHPPNYIYTSLDRILKEEKHPLRDDECVGSLTTLDRDTWADIRSQMASASQQNQQSLNEIENALFLLCIDDLNSSDPERLMQSLLCGDDGRNRWFDKCFQLIVDGNGQTTINFEHSWGDGVAVLRLMEESLKDTTENRFVAFDEQPSQSVPTEKLVKKLDWNLNDSLRAQIKSARETHIRTSQSLDFGVVEHRALSKSAIKRAKLSPDAVMQMAIQIAFHSMYREFVPTYESCSTAAFLKGRTECIRSATVATKETVLALQKGNVAADELFGRIRKSSEVHSKLVKEASLGQGFDRHLFGLREAAKRLGRPPNPLFAHPVFEQMGRFVLSTSTLSTDTIYFGGFGAVVPDGLGIGYNVTDEKLGAVVTSYKEKRSAKQFCDALNAGLDKIREVIEATRK